MAVGACGASWPASTEACGSQRRAVIGAGRPLRRGHPRARATRARARQGRWTIGARPRESAGPALLARMVGAATGKGGGEAREGWGGRAGGQGGRRGEPRVPGRARRRRRGGCLGARCGDADA